MNIYQNISNMEEVELYPGFLARMIHTPESTLSYVRCVAGAQLPAHQHPEVQILNLLKGEMTVQIGEDPVRRIDEGEVIYIPSNTPHTVTAITECLALDIFSPSRESYAQFGVHLK